MKLSNMHQVPLFSRDRWNFLKTTQVKHQTPRFCVNSQIVKARQALKITIYGPATEMFEQDKVYQFTNANGFT